MILEIIMVEKDDKSNTDINKALESMEDWYRAVIFDSSSEVLAVKNVDKVNKDELK